MRKLIETDFKDAIQGTDYDPETMRFAMDFDLGIIRADDVAIDEIKTDEFLDSLIAKLNDDELLEARDFFANIFMYMY